MRRTLATVALVLASLVLAFAIGECGVRGLEATGWIADEQAALFPEVGPRGKFMRSDNELLRFELDPSDPIVNEAGFRGTFVPVERGDGPRVVAIGDSVTFGRGVPVGETWPEVLEERLRQARPDAEVLNFGVGGYNAQQVVERYRVRARIYAPDVVVYGFVLNDCMPAGAHLGRLRAMREAAGRPTPGPDAPAEAAPGRSAWPTSRLVALVRRRLALFEDTRRGMQNPNTWCGLPPFWGPALEALKDLARMAHVDRTPVVVAVFPLLEDFGTYPYAPFHERIVGAARQLGLDAIDLLPALAQADPETLRVTPRDTTHPNGLGQRLAAEAIHAHLVARGHLGRSAPP